MAQFSLRGNPYLAGFLGLLVIGLGHVYLRRWLRAIGWLAVGIGVSIVMTLVFPPDPSAPIVDPTEMDPMTLLPTVLITSASAVDAYLLARRERERPAAGGAGGAPVTDGETVSCPYCGGEVDPDLGFCHWCTREFEVAPESTTPDQEPSRSE